MKMRTLNLLFLLLASCSAFTQQPKWDSTYRPASYSLKVGQFKSFANKKSDIIFLGNSITAGTDWNELLGLSNARNRGISGDITFGVLERLDEVIEGQPAKVFILIGINDISRNIPDSVIIHNYRKMVQRIQACSPTTKIYMQTLLPVNNEFTQFKNHYNKDVHIVYVNAAIKQLVKECKVNLIDLNPGFQDANGKLDEKYTEDGLHLNIEGYKVWASILKKGNYLK